MIKLERWQITNEDENTVLGALALVKKPATRSDFKLLQENEDTYQTLTDEEWETKFFEENLIEELEAEVLQTGEVDKQLAETLSGKNLLAVAILIPNKPIKRVDPVTKEVSYGFFDQDSVRNGAYKFNRLGRQSNFNLEHNPDAYVPDVHLVENWIVEYPYYDKALSLGYLVNKGTWFGLVQVKNEELYEEAIKTGMLRGVSIEASTRDTVISQ